MTQRSANDADKAIGVRLRASRIEKGMSQAVLGLALGVSFQQVQKYEKGMNRLTSTRLSECARLLGKPIGWFLEGPAGSNRFEPDLGSLILATSAGKRLVQTYLNAGPRERAAILAVADALATEPPHVLKAVG